MAPSQEPIEPKKSEPLTDSSNSPLIICDGPWDNTIRPARPNLPRYYPGRKPPNESNNSDSPPQTPPSENN